MSQISVIVPVYNAAGYLGKAVESLLRENLSGLEIIVVDDGSTDGGVQEIEGLPVKLLRQENRGEAAARNAGVKAASAPFVTFLDADDLISRGSLAARLDYLASHPEERVVGGMPSNLLDGAGRVLAEVFPRMAEKYSFPFRLNESFYRAGNFFPVSCALYLYRKDIFDQIGLYDEALAVAPDCDFHFRLLKKTDVEILKIPVFDRRIHGENLSLVGQEKESLSFRSEILQVVREINRRHGFNPVEITPWEQEYL